MTTPTKANAQGQVRPRTGTAQNDGLDVAGNLWAGQTAYALWVKAYLAGIGEAPIKPARATSRSSVDLAVSLFLTMAALGAGEFGSTGSTRISQLLGLGDGLTPAYFAKTLEANRISGSLKLRLHELASVTGAMEAAGMMRGQPGFLALIEGMGAFVVGAGANARPAATTEMGRLVAGLRQVSEKSAKAYASTVPSVEGCLAEIDALVGLRRVKEEVLSLVNNARVMAVRAARGMPVPVVTRHLVFTGNPGTGKTTVARIVGRMYGALGLLSKGHMVEVDRSQLVAGHLGQTALKTREAVDRAMGGVLFVDEAYTLVAGPQDMFGYEAVETLMKAMEDHRGDLVVVMAGYASRMDAFLDTNPGLRSRLPKTLDFEDYGERELLSIIAGLAREARYRFDQDARVAVSSALTDLCAVRGEGFGNGRLARNFFEAVVARQSDRVAVIDEASDEDLATVMAPDVAAAARGMAPRARNA